MAALAIEALAGVPEVLMALLIDARVPEGRALAAPAPALAQAKDVGQEYESVEVATATVARAPRGARRS